MPLDKIQAPTLVVHHKQDGCTVCRYEDLPQLMGKLTAAPREKLLTFGGGKTKGNPCQSMASHGFNGVEPGVVAKIAQWIARK